MASKELKILLKDKIGYRNDDMGTGYYTIEDILDFEMNELGNVDIPDTCEQLYGTEDVRKVIKDKFGTLKVNGLWLSTKEGIIRNYGEGEDTEITGYKIPGNALVISDLDDEGILFVFKESQRSLIVSREIV